MHSTPTTGSVSLREFFDAVAVASLYAAFFAGRFALDRLPVWPASVPAPGMRELATLVCLGVIGISILRGRTPEISRAGGTLLAAVLCLHTLLATIAVASGDPASAGDFVRDLYLLVVQLACALVLLREWRNRLWFAWTAVLAATTFALLAAAGFGSPEIYGEGWAPLGSPLTFQRVELAGFFAAMYLVGAASSVPARAMLATLAALALFASLASLLKAGLIAALAGIVFVAIRDLANQRILAALFLIVISSIALAFFFETRGPLFEARVKEAVEQGTIVSEETAEDVADSVLRSIEKDFASDPQTAETLRSVCGRERIKDILTSGSQLLPQSTAEFYCLRYLNRALLPKGIRQEDLVTFLDRSHRARLFARAWLDFRGSPWVGIGPGRYRFVADTSFDTQPRTYTYPHNLFLEFLSTTGLLGTISLILTLLYAIFLLERWGILATPDRYWYGLAISVLIGSQFAGDYFEFRIFWMCCIVALAAEGHLSSRQRVKVVGE